MSKDSYAGALWEEMNERLKLVQESLSTMKDLPADVRQIKTDMAEMKQWCYTTTSVIKDQSKTLNNHETRLTKLETV